ncbi:MAG: N-acetyltransferase [Chlamydiae bacterium CG10_big_fil_rev_8_21_14_0_10_42_34]|nr:MAG: N-acetyltransferase [Chlamydiae bacterium CG10_big_fil_rev_8_21_14_0_10_42_34]
MNSLEGFDIRYTLPEDLSYLQKWFEDPSACNDYPFTNDEKSDALKNWIGFGKYKASLTGMINDVPCAIGTLFLMPYRKVAHHCSFYLMVDPAMRGKGIGTSMLKNLLHLAKTRFRLESVHVEIYEPSDLLPLLLKEGFVQFVRQENFVKIDGIGHARLLLEHSFNG